jgi:hypothetical protein
MTPQSVIQPIIDLLNNGLAWTNDGGRLNAWNAKNDKGISCWELNNDAVCFTLTGAAHRCHQTSLFNHQKAFDILAKVFGSRCVGILDDNLTWPIVKIKLQTCLEIESTK